MKTKPNIFTNNCKDELPNTAVDFGMGKTLIRFLKVYSTVKLLSKCVNSCFIFLKKLDLDTRFCIVVVAYEEKKQAL